MINIKYDSSKNEMAVMETDCDCTSQYIEETIVIARAMIAHFLCNGKVEKKDYSSTVDLFCQGIKEGFLGVTSDEQS